MVRNIASQRDIFFRYALSVGRFIYIQCRFHIADHTAHIDRDSGFGNDTARCFIYQNLLVTSRIHVRQNADFHIIRKSKRLNALFQNRNNILVLTLDANDRLISADQAASHFKASNDVIRIKLHQLLVHPQQRFALGTVEQNIIRFGRQLNMCRESGAACTDNPRILDHL